MNFRRHLRSILPYTWEVFTRYKVAWGGASLVIVGAAVYAAVTSHNYSRHEWVFILMLAVIGAQFWHGLMQYERIQPRFEVRPPELHHWGLPENRGSAGIGYFVELFNPSISESMECVRAELISMEPDSTDGLIPFPLHIRHMNYCVAETFINPGCSQKFDLATGPDQSNVSQRVIVIPGIIGGDRGYSNNGVQIPFGPRYHLRVRFSARHCSSIEIGYQLWVDEQGLLRCAQDRL